MAFRPCSFKLPLLLKIPFKYLSFFSFSFFQRMLRDDKAAGVKLRVIVMIFLKRVKRI